MLLTSVSAVILRKIVGRLLGMDVLRMHVDLLILPLMRISCENDDGGALNEFGTKKVQDESFIRSTPVPNHLEA